MTTTDGPPRADADLKSIFWSVPALYFRVTADGTIVDFRPGRADDLHMPPERYFGKRMAELLPEAVGRQVADAIAATIAQRVATTVEYPLAVPSGEKRFEAHLVPYAADQAVLVVRDVSEQHRALEAMNAARADLETQVAARTAALERTLAALRESEERFRALAENSPDVIMRFDRDGRHLYANGAVLAMTGIPARDFIGKTYRQLGFPQVLCELWEGAIASVFATGRTQHVEFELPTHIWIDWLLVPELAADRSVAAVIADARDITTIKHAGEALERRVAERTAELAAANAALQAEIAERRRSEEEVRRSLAWQEAIFEGSRDAMFISDARSRFTAVNGAACELSGYSRDELLRMRIPDLHEDVDLLAYEAFHDRILAGEEFVSEARIRRKDGRKVDAEFNNRRVVIGGASYMHTVARDVTERKRTEAALLRSESELRAMFELASIGIAQADPSTGRWLRVNQKFSAITGYTAEELLGLRIPDITHPDDRQEDAELFERVVRGEAADYRLEKRYIRKDGSVVWVNVNMTVIRDPSGHPIRTIATIEDVTERKRAAEALSEKNRELTETLRQLEQSRTMLRMIIESIPARVFWKDRDLRYLGCNSNFANNAGFSDPGQVVGKDDFAMVWREQAELYRADDRQVMASGHPKMNITEPQTTPAGNTIWLSTSKVPLMKADGEVFGLLGVYDDVTERKDAEEALRESEERYRLIAENTADVIWTLDIATLRFTYVSPSVERLRGFTAEEVLAQPFAAGLTPDSLHRVVAHLAASLAALAAGDQSARTSTIEADMPTKDGGVVRTEVVATALCDGSGQVTSVLGVTRDITERKRAEAALRESEERYRSLFEQSPLGIYRTTPDGRILVANPALLQMLGYASMDEVGSLNLEDTGFQPEYPRHLFKAAIERVGEVRDFETTWTTKDGRRAYLRHTARQIRDADGRSVYYEGIVEDVTAQRRGEEERRRLVAAVEQASETMVITDTEGRIEYANPAFERTSGYTREEAIGHELNMLRTGEHDDAYYARLWQTITHSENWHGRFVNRRKDGSLYTEEAAISPIRDDTGTIVNFVVVKRDVTQEVTLQDQLRQSQKMEAVGILAGGVAHDFNNLLQGMLNQVEVVRGRHADADRMAATMAELEAQIRRGSTLTRQLLLFGKRETAKPEQFDLNAGIRGAATFLGRLIRANIGYRMDLAGESLPVTADRGQIDQVLMNLVVNAVEAMPGGGRLTIRSGREGEDWVWFAADDTGGGIPDEVRERIFEPFFTTKGKGTGLGLSVVHGIVTQHGGKVTFEALPGGGTSFRVTLPRAGSGEHPIVPTPVVDPSATPAGHGERVLVVEDEDGARQGLVEILQMLEYDVVAVRSGEEAGLLPQDPGFDVLLTDLMLPGVAGNDLARGLEDRWPKLKVILMSGYAQDEAVRRGAFTGRVRFLQKPFDLASLAREIRAALEE